MTDETLTTPTENILDSIIFKVQENPNSHTFEISFFDDVISEFFSEEDANSVAKSMHIVFETGYTNGMFLGTTNRDKAIEELKERGFKTQAAIRFED